MIIVPDLATVERTATSDAERRLARLLSRVDGGPDAVAFHSVRLRAHEYKQQAEADFIVLWKGAVLVLEVKGGGVRKHDGIWYSIDRRDDWHRLRTSPMEQARSAAYALRDILKQDGVGWFAYEPVVVTPDIDAPDASVEWGRSHWWAKDDMTLDGVRDALDGVVHGARQAPAGVRAARINDLRSRLFGEFTRMPVVDAQRGAVLDEQSRATEGQSKVLAALARSPRLLVHGGAGTGKSLVLVEAAKQEVDQHQRVLVTFRSPHLADFFTKHLDGRPVDIIPFDVLPAGRTWDVVLVDEAQDLMTATDMDTLDQVVEGGRAKGRWRLFLDHNNQAHVDGTYDEVVHQLITEEAVPVDLSLNVRNTRAIVHVVQSYLGADVGDAGIVHGERVSWHQAPTNPNLPVALELAQDLVADGARRDEVCIVKASADGPPALDRSGFRITNPRSVKGLEAEHVIVCDLPTEYNAAGTAAFYVAVTRARVSLHMVLCPDDRTRLQHLSRALSA